MPFHAIPYHTASGSMTMLACITSHVLLPEWSRHLDLCERAQLKERFSLHDVGDKCVCRRCRQRATAPMAATVQGGGGRGVVGSRYRTWELTLQFKLRQSQTLQTHNHAQHVNQSVL